jgi:DNA-binding response OmpR family regulator
VLHVDDDPDTLEVTALALEGRARVAHARDLSSARAYLAENRPDLVIVDLALPDGSGEALVADLAMPEALGTPVIVYSAQDHPADFAREVSAVLTKSRRSLSSLIETVIDLLGRQSNDRGGKDER